MNNVRTILPKMVAISNNSQVTNQVANLMAYKLTPEEFMIFNRWLMISLDNQHLDKNNYPPYIH